MNEQMEFPETFEQFAKEYGFKDDKEVYTNGSDLIQIFRVKQWLKHDNKLHTIETGTAYKCGKHSNKAEQRDVLDTIRAEIVDTGAYEQEVHGRTEFLEGINYCLTVLDKYKIGIERKYGTQN